MTTPHRPEPLAAATRVTTAARDLATDLADGIRKSERSVKLRAAVIGTWVVLALVSFWIACPSTGPANSLGAVARLESGGIMGAQVLVQNDGPELWADVILTLDGGWTLRRPTVRPGDKLVLPVASFSRAGQAAPAELVPRHLTIECQQGTATAALGAARP